MYCTKEVLYLMYKRSRKAEILSDRGANSGKNNWSSTIATIMDFGKQKEWGIHRSLVERVEIVDYDSPHEDYALWYGFY